MPCVHMASVINDRNYFTKELFHLRWWKSFNLLYKHKDVGIGNNNSFQYSCKEELEKSLLFVRDHHYDKNTGRYKGVSISHDLVVHLNNIRRVERVENICTTTDINDPMKKKLLKASILVEMNAKNEPCLKGS